MKLIAVGGNIKATSDNFQKFKDGEYDRMSMHLSYGCSEIYGDVLNSTPVNPNCSFSSTINFFSLNLTEAKNRINHIVGIAFKNLDTGELYSKVIDVNFDHYVTTCPSGCLLDTLSPHYDTIFENIIDDLIVENNINEDDFSIDICGDDLLIKDFPDNIVPYSLTYDDGKVDYFKFNDTKKYILSGSSLYLTPGIINMPSFTDGVIGLRLRFYLPNEGWVEEQQCFFNDVTIKCKVAKYSKELLSGDVKTSERIHILHYSLVNSSNCGDCNCANMCEMYNTLQALLANNPQITNEEDCGCQ